MRRINQSYHEKTILLKVFLLNGTQFFDIYQLRVQLVVKKNNSKTVGARMIANDSFLHFLL